MISGAIMYLGPFMQMDASLTLYILLLNTISIKFSKILCIDSPILIIVEYPCNTFSEFAHGIHVPSNSQVKPFALQ